MDKGIMVKLDLNSMGFNNGVKSAVASTKELKTALGSADNAMQKHGDIANKVGSGLKAVAQTAIVGLAAAGTATAALIGQSVKSFADYEQLVGGVDTLFKESSGAVQANAQKAFSTAGLSANAYMETVTSFSASLLQSLNGDTVKAASYADSAIIDMSDNANKMGTSMESIQNAYQGFAKQNYTMLDNLKLGYGGTKEEMQRLLDDAQKISGIKYNISSFADVTQAIHVMQVQMDMSGYSADELRQRLKDMSLTQSEVQKVADSMGISYEEATEKMKTGALTVKDASVLLGTTAKEASTTISGSFNAMKAAWSNTLTALVTGGEYFDNSVDALKDSVLTFAENIMPAIEGALEGVGVLLQDLAPAIAEELPKLLAKILPGLAKSAVQMVKALGKGIVENAPLLMEALFEALQSAVGSVAPNLAPAMGEIGKSLSGAMSSIGNAIAPILPKIGEVLSKVVSVVANILPPIINTVSSVITALAPIADIIISVISDLMSSLAPVITTLVPCIGEIVSALAPLVTTLVQVLQPAIKMTVTVIQSALTIITPILEAAFKHAALLIQFVVQLLHGDFAGAWQSIKDMVANALNYIKNLASAVVNAIGNYFAGVASIIGGILGGIWQGVVDTLSSIGSSITSAVSGVVGAIGSTLQGIIGVFNGVFNSVLQTVSGIFENIKNTVKDKITAAVNTVREVFGRIKQIVSDVWNGIKGIIKVPHIEVVGNLSIAGLDTPIPKLGLKWYAAGGIMDRPTVFAGTGNTAHIGGEAGPEAILPLKPFWDKLERYMTNDKHNGGNRIERIEQHFEININGTDRTPDEMADMVVNNIIPRVKLAMSNI